MLQDTAKMSLNASKMPEDVPKISQAAPKRHPMLPRCPWHTKTLPNGALRHPKTPPKAFPEPPRRPFWIDLVNFLLVFSTPFRCILYILLLSAKPCFSCPPAAHTYTHTHTHTNNLTLTCAHVDSDFELILKCFKARESLSHLLES